MLQESNNSSRSLRIAIGVGGRFHADRMAEALLGAGHELELFTSLPKSRFRNLVPKEKIHTCVTSELYFRGMGKLGLHQLGADWKMRSFNRFFSRALKKKISDPDVLIAWSSFARDTFRNEASRIKILVRDSAHICEQIEILEREYSSMGLRFPSHALVREFELEEYELSDYILVPSEYVKSSFIQRGVQSNKIKVIRLGADLNVFSHAKKSKLGRPLRLINFGSLTVQKGIQHLLSAISSFSSEEIKLTLVGSLSSEIKPLLKNRRDISQIDAVPQNQLSSILGEQDVFVMPSVHDGFGMVVPQAMAAGLIPIVTDSVGAAEIIQDRVTGFVIPSGSSRAITSTLRELIDNESLAHSIQKNLLDIKTDLSWSDYRKNVANWIHSIR